MYQDRGWHAMSDPLFPIFGTSRSESNERAMRYYVGTISSATVAYYHSVIVWYHIIAVP